MNVLDGKWKDKATFQLLYLQSSYEHRENVEKVGSTTWCAEEQWLQHWWKSMLARFFMSNSDRFRDIRTAAVASALQRKLLQRQFKTYACLLKNEIVHAERPRHMPWKPATLAILPQISKRKKKKHKALVLPNNGLLLHFDTHKFLRRYSSY